MGKGWPLNLSMNQDLNLLLPRTSSQMKVYSSGHGLHYLQAGTLGHLHQQHKAPVMHALQLKNDDACWKWACLSCGLPCFWEELKPAVGLAAMPCMQMRGPSTWPKAVERQHQADVTVMSSGIVWKRCLQ